MEVETRRGPESTTPGLTQSGHANASCDTPDLQPLLSLSVLLLLSLSLSPSLSLLLLLSLSDSVGSRPSQYQG